MNELTDMINGVLSNPEEMKKVMELANSIMGESGVSPDELPSPAVSPTMPDLQRLFGGFGGGRKSELLNALKPFLSERRRQKLERAMGLSGMAKAGIALLNNGGGVA